MAKDSDPLAKILKGAYPELRVRLMEGYINLVLRGREIELDRCDDGRYDLGHGPLSLPVASMKIMEMLDEIPVKDVGYIEFNGYGPNEPDFMGNRGQARFVPNEPDFMRGNWVKINFGDHVAYASFAPNRPSDLGMIPLGAGQTFNVMFKF